jgi:hypothetical protein
MAVNKVIYDGNTLVDLTGDTVTATDLADGVKATGADGNPIVGLMKKLPLTAHSAPAAQTPCRIRLSRRNWIKRWPKPIKYTKLTLHGVDEILQMLMGV